MLRVNILDFVPSNFSKLIELECISSSSSAFEWIKKYFTADDHLMDHFHLYFLRFLRFFEIFELIFDILETLFSA